MLQATTAGQGVSFVHHCLESAETLLRQQADHVNVERGGWEERRREEGEAERGDGFSGRQVVFRYSAGVCEVWNDFPAGS